MHTFAINPLQWLAGPDGNLDKALAPPRRELLRQVSDSGFSAISLAMLDDDDPGAYGAELDEAGLSAAPGYFSFDLTTTDLEPVFEAVDRLARAHRHFGLSEIFLAGRPSAERMAAPARGVNPDRSRDAVIARNVTAVSARFLDSGVRACFHQHVGTWVETGDELLSLVSETPEQTVFLGPDTGHLTWAGIDPVSFVAEHSERVLGVHMKDIRTDRLATAGGSYSEVIAHGILTEPGRGGIDNDGVLDALPEDFPGWVVIEVDHPDAGSPAESAAISARWALERS